MTDRDHTMAMHCVEAALQAQRKGDSKQAEGFYDLALELEQKAALRALESGRPEPLTSVLLHSAAEIALVVEDFERAQELAEKGLSGDDVPEDVYEGLLRIQKTARAGEK